MRSIGGGRPFWRCSRRNVRRIRPAAFGLRRQARAHTHDGALLDWRLPPVVRSSYGPVAAAVGALGGPAVGARATGCAYSRLPQHATLPFVGSF